MAATLMRFLAILVLAARPRLLKSKPAASSEPSSIRTARPCRTQP